MHECFHGMEDRINRSLQLCVVWAKLSSTSQGPCSQLNPQGRSQSGGGNVCPKKTLPVEMHA